MTMNKSLYIHIPFCRQKCLYCDFYSIGYQDDLARSYVDVLCRQIAKLPSRFDTIYIGGGTPTVLAVDKLSELLQAVHKKRAIERLWRMPAVPFKKAEEIRKNK